jgi:hypothetical protein
VKNVDLMAEKYGQKIYRTRKTTISFLWKVLSTSHTSVIKMSTGERNVKVIGCRYSLIP